MPADREQLGIIGIQCYRVSNARLGNRPSLQKILRPAPTKIDDLPKGGPGRNHRIVWFDLKGSINKSTRFFVLPFLQARHERHCA